MLGRRAIWVWLVLALLVAFMARLLIGTGGTYSLSEVWRSLFTGGEWTSDDDIIRNIRLVRALAAVLVGFALGTAGSALQSLFRNPLADPYVAGVSSGAAVGGALAFVTGFTVFSSQFGMVLASFAGGGFALILVMALATHRRALVPERLLLSGVMVGALLAAILSFVLLAAGQDTRMVLNWLLGSLSSVSQASLLPLLVGIAVGVPVLLIQAKRLNVLAIGADAARRSGVNVGGLAISVLLATTLMVSITVGVAGIIGFLGLAAPHIARRLVGVDWRSSLMASGFIGSVLLCLADLAAQMTISATEVPVGIVTALVGAPFLLILLRRD